MMRLTPSAAILTVVTLLLSDTTAAQKHPNIELGFNAGKLYQFSDLDAVNLFNGNLVVQIPIGDTYPVNAQFQYGLTLVYNSKMWDYDQSYDSQDPTGPLYTIAYPNHRSNAGVGWRLSMGRLFPPGSASATDNVWVYEGPSGDEHEFWTEYGVPYNSDQSLAYELLYSTDGSRLRMQRVSASERLVQFPNGDVHQFIKGCSGWRLREMRDAFGNNLTVTPTCDAGGRETQWELVDSLGRRHRVEFQQLAGTELSESLGQHVSKIHLSTVAGELSYEFVYEQNATVEWGCGHYVPERWQVPATASLPLLKSILRPDGTTFAFTYFKTQGEGGGVCSQGALKALTLPTLGKFIYKYQLMPLPEKLCVVEKYSTRNPGVASRNTPSGRWDYVTTSSKPALTPAQVAEACAAVQPGDLEPGEERHPTGNTLRRWSRMTVLAPPVPYGDGFGRVRTDNLFYVWPEFAPADSWNPLATSSPERRVVTFGQPITTGAPPVSLAGVNAPAADDADAREGNNESPAAPHYLSTRMFEGCADELEGSVTGTCTGGRLLRSTYLRFPSEDALLSRYPLESRRTKYHDDNGCANCWLQTTNSDPDGYGTFRQTTTSTTFPEGGGFSSKTNYLGPPANGKWLLDRYDKTERTENGRTAVTEYCFNESTGFLEGVRTRASSQQRTTSDLLTRFSGTMGNVEREESYGGHPGSISETEACASSETRPQYLTRNTYEKGRLARSEACDPATSGSGCTSVLMKADVSFHASGAPMTSRDPSGLLTEYGYDSFGRLETVKTRDAATSLNVVLAGTYVRSTTYAYTPATSTAPATVEEKAVDPSSAVTLTTTKYEFDSLGRPFRVTSSLPQNKKASVMTEFDGLGRKKKTSQPYDSTTTPVNWTETRYDAFGRPTWSRQPGAVGDDSRITTLTYQGDRVTTRTSRVATSVTSQSLVSVTEHYDAQRRLRKVTEHSGNTSATAVKGTAVETSYTYDVAGRLTQVATSGAPAQSPRLFEYDARGFFLSETHPENGTTSYAEHDARGHARKKTVGVTELTLTYDGAERLTLIKNGSKLVSKFDFALANTGTNLTKGKLLTAVRRNELPSAGIIDVTETYEYASQAGQLSRRTTAVDQVTSAGTTRIQEFVYTVPKYDRFLQPETVGMPTCGLHGCTTSNGLGSLGYTRSAGYLTNVTSFASLAYAPSGMIETVTHLPGNSEDKYDAVFGLARPSKVTLGGSAACPLPTITALDSVCSSSTSTASVTVEGGATYEWSIEGGTIISTAGATITYQPNVASGTVTLTATATNACGISQSSKTIAIASSPAASTITASASVCANSTGNQASVPFRAGITHAWQISGGTITAGANGESVTFTAGSSAVTLTVTATSGSCSTSSSKTISISEMPTATLVLSGPATITRGESTVLNVNFTGPAPRRVVWGDGYVQDNISTSFVERTVTPNQTTTYTLASVSAAGCNGSVSGSVTITVRPPALTSVVATTQGNQIVAVTWGSATDAAAYRIERTTVVGGGASWSLEVSGESTSYPDTVPASTGPVTYIYYVLVKDQYGEWSTRGGFDHATGAATLWTQAIVPGQTMVKGADIQDLRNAVDAFRVAFNRPRMFSGSVAPAGLISAANVTAVVNALNEARVANGYGAFDYANVSPPAMNELILAAHIQQLRDALR